MSDIVERLRDVTVNAVSTALCEEAADEIENLRRAIQVGGRVGNKALAECEALRALNAELVEALAKSEEALRQADCLALNEVIKPRVKVARATARAALTRAREQSDEGGGS